MLGHAQAIAVLCSGGLDSAILVGHLLRGGRRVFPLYIRSHLLWETVEQAYLERYVQELKHSSAGFAVECLEPVTVLDMPVGDLYGHHWSISGENVPDARSEDTAVYLPGRNLLLLAKGLIWCHLRGVPEIALAHLKGNPFGDAREEFFAALETAIYLSSGQRIAIRRPFAHMDKAAVLHLGRDLPLHWTFSCIQPEDGQHCGRCNKCAERRRAFREAGLSDPTWYAAPAG
ncbi:MAG: 7-cyano-7-deazaguanine synthase [Gemmataceae bacterium]